MFDAKQKLQPNSGKQQGLDSEKSRFGLAWQGCAEAERPAQADQENDGRARIMHPKKNASIPFR